MPYVTCLRLAFCSALTVKMADIPIGSRGMIGDLWSGLLEVSGVSEGSTLC